MVTVDNTQWRRQPDHGRSFSSGVPQAAV